MQFEILGFVCIFGHIVFTFETNTWETTVQSRFASVVFDGVLEPPRLERHTRWCPSISVDLDATHTIRLMALERLSGRSDREKCPL